MPHLFTIYCVSSQQTLAESRNGVGRQVAPSGGSARTPARQGKGDGAVGLEQGVAGSNPVSPTIFVRFGLVEIRLKGLSRFELDSEALSSTSRDVFARACRRLTWAYVVTPSTRRAHLKCELSRSHAGRAALIHHLSRAAYATARWTSNSPRIYDRDVGRVTRGRRHDGL
jgi:hypothetical protein